MAVTVRGGRTGAGDELTPDVLPEGAQLFGTVQRLCRCSAKHRRRRRAQRFADRLTNLLGRSVPLAQICLLKAPMRRTTVAAYRPRAEDQIGIVIGDAQHRR
jgi:hypothetical protein